MCIFTAHAIHVAMPCYVMQERVRKGRSLHIKGMVAVALTLLRFNSLGWSVTPTYFWKSDFFFTNSHRLQKNEQKINVGSLKFSYFSTHATLNPINLRLSNSVVSRLGWFYGTLSVDLIC